MLEIVDARASSYEMALHSCRLATDRAAARLEREAAAAVDVQNRRGSGLQRHSWKGAEISRIYSDWFASLTSPDDELRAGIRQLRARARELSRNNPYAGGYVEKLSTSVVGPQGFRLQPKTRDRSGVLQVAVNKTIASAWKDWSEGPVSADGRMSLLEFEDLCFQTMVREGECFVERVVRPDMPHGLALRIIDPDLVDDTYTVYGRDANPEIYMGVEVDPLGRRRGYWLLDYYQYGPGYEGRGRRRVDAAGVLHLYRPWRANQMRGITWFARVMAALHDLERYLQNELVASAAAAAKMGFILNKGTPVAEVLDDNVGNGVAGAGGTGSGSASSTDPASGSARARLHVEAEPGTIWELDRDQEFQEWDPKHPAQAFGDFTKNVLHAAAAGLYGSVFESLTTDYSQVTYLSARAARIDNRAIVQRLQQSWIRIFHRPLVDWWLQSALLTGDLGTRGGDWRRYREVGWIPCGQDWIDPQKDAAAAQTMLDLRLTTRTRLAAARGDDFLELLDETAAEQDEAAKRGVDLTLVPPVKRAAPPTDPTAGAQPPPADATPGDEGADPAEDPNAEDA